MELYDPNNPRIVGSYNFFELSGELVNQFFSDYLQHNMDLLLVFNQRFVGRISFVINKIFCQSKSIHGILQVQTECFEAIGHLIIVHGTTHFIPTADCSFLVNEDIIYKSNRKIYHTNTHT